MYHSKYIKYKTEYLHAKSMNGGNDTNLIYSYNQYGSGIKTAKTFYDNFFINPKRKNELNNYIENLNKDNYLKSLVNPNDQFTFTVENIQTYKDKIFCILSKKLEDIVNQDTNYDNCESFSHNKFRDTYIDWLVRNYTMGNIGKVEDIYRVKESLKIYALLNNNKVFKGEDSYLSLGLNKVNGIEELNTIIDKYDKELKEIYEKKEKQANTVTKHKKIKEKGENPEAIVLNTNYLTIYAPKTVDESKYYGCNTKWCTASSDNNMFENYNKRGQLFIIEPKIKTHTTERYQLHFEDKQYMKEDDKSIKLEELRNRFKDDNEFLIWLKLKACSHFYKEKVNIIDIYDVQCLYEADNKLKNKIKEIDFSNSEFNQKLEQGVLPDLTSLTLGDQFNQKLDPGVLPPNLTNLKFGESFNQKLDQGVLPGSLTSLKFGDQFNQKLDPGVFSNNLTNLKFGQSFNQKIDQGVLPASLTNLEFGFEFNQAIDPNILPTNLTHLVLGPGFNQPLVPGVLPANLAHLGFGFGFNQPLIPGLLPANLKHLVLGSGFNQPLVAGLLPANLTDFVYGGTQLFTRGVLPQDLKSLTFNDRFNITLEPGVLPQNLTSLTFGFKFNRTLEPGVLPPNLKSLTFGDQFDMPLKSGVLPPNLKNLTFGSDFNYWLKPGVLPQNLTMLTFGYGFNQKLEPGVLPKKLTNLKFGNNYNIPLRSLALPDSLTHLELGENFNQPFDPDVLPSNLKELIIKNLSYPYWEQLKKNYPKINFRKY